MADRQTIYTGQLARSTDFLLAQQNGMVGLAKLSAAVLGSTTIVNGFTVTPTGPASLSVIVTAGEVYQVENIEQSTWSSLGTNTNSILKQGIVLTPTTIGITPPATGGFSQNFLVEVQYQDVNSGSTVLPYFNASNPTLPFSGPGNAGTAQNTVRQGVAAIQIKAGTAATTGTQTTPSADAGWTGIYVVTVANGASTITSGNITKLSTAPFIPTTLPNVPITSQTGIWIYSADTGSADAMAITLSPVPASYQAGMVFWVLKSAAANATTAPTLNVNGLGAKSIVKQAGGALIPSDLPASSLIGYGYDGTNFRVVGFVASDLNAQKSPFNQMEIINTTRTSFSSITGFTNFVTGTYVKKSSTSILVIRTNTNSFDGNTGVNCGVMRVNIGSTNIDTTNHVSTSTTSSPACTTERQITALAAGSYSYTISYGRNDANAWTSIINPTSSDAGFLPTISGTSIVFNELEP